MWLEHAIRHGAKATLQGVSWGGFCYRLSGANHLYLTFDDGPHSRHTRDVLAVLRQYRVHATFFLIGRHVRRQPDVVQEMAHDGHTIGLHTDTHTAIDLMSRSQFNQEIEANTSAIRAAIGDVPRLLRPPQGRLRLRNLRWARSLGLKIVHYTVTSNDWRATSREDVIAEVARHRIRGGDILSFHDTTPFTPAALPQLIERYRSRGFEFRRISLS